MSSEKPQLFIIAGPNGAGKSTISTSLLKSHHLKAFDWDKAFDLKWSVFGYDPLVEPGVREAVNTFFDTQRNEAIKNSKSFSFETNYHTKAILKIVEEFQDAGFETNIYFLLVSDVDICKQRVAYRVRIEQGHDVNASTIEERFEKGLKLLDDSFSDFNRAFLFDTSPDYQAALIATFENGNLVDKYKLLPGTVRGKLNNINNLIRAAEGPLKT